MDKPLQKIDHMMWDVETPTSLVTITGMMILNDPMRKNQLEELIEKRLLRYERFHKKIVTGKNPPVWHVDEYFDFRSHVHHIALPSKGTYTELQDVVSDLMSQPLDYSKPLWQVHLIDNYLGGQVILWRLHHAIADGIALIKVVFSLTGTSREESLNMELPLNNYDPVKEEVSSFREELKYLFQSGTDVYRAALKLLKHPDELKDKLVDSWYAAKDLGNLLISPSLEGTMYKGPLSVSKKAAWTSPLPLSRLKEFALHHHVTINDLLLALTTGAIRKHLLSHNQPVEKGLRVICPVNVRKKDEFVKVHNKIGMLSIELPVHIANFKERLAFIKEKTTLLKHSWEPFIVYNLLSTMADIIPKKLERKISEIIGDRVAGVVTNIPGPKHAIYIAGARVEEMIFWVPQTAPLGIGISVISYNTSIYMGIVTDTKLVPDPDKIIEGFYEEYDMLESLLCAEEHVN